MNGPLAKKVRSYLELRLQDLRRRDLGVVTQKDPTPEQLAAAELEHYERRTEILILEALERELGADIPF